MLIYGTNRSRIALEEIDGICPNCGKSNSLQLGIVQIYVHFFFIPTYPRMKVGLAKCNVCKKLMARSEFDEKLMDNYLRLRHRTNTPIWVYTGLFIILLFILFIIYMCCRYG